jgi:hypothetical protein
MHRSFVCYHLDQQLWVVDMDSFLTMNRKYVDGVSKEELGHLIVWRTQDAKMANLTTL